MQRVSTADDKDTAQVFHFSLSLTQSKLFLVYNFFLRNAFYFQLIKTLVEILTCYSYIKCVYLQKGCSIFITPFLEISMTQSIQNGGGLFGSQHGIPAFKACRDESLIFYILTRS